MFVAVDRFDENGNRIYADLAEKNIKCFCPVCGEKVKLRKGKTNRPHFAHTQDSDCSYGKDKDYMSEWHIRMQAYFPREFCEVRFVDEKTGEIHIADVFLKESNTVLEFQHSPISEEEFIHRTAFHINNGRRIAWFFDESSTGEKEFGRFRLIEDSCSEDILFYQWLRCPRKSIKDGPNLKQYYKTYCVCVYTGTEGDIFHRIIEQRDDYREVGFSKKQIEMTDVFQVDDLFEYDTYWVNKDIAIRNWQEFERRGIEQIKNLPRCYVQRGTNRRRRRF